MKKIFLLLCVLVISGIYSQAMPRRDAAGPLRFGIVPAVDSLPLMLAEQRGYFAQEGADVELVFFPNPHEREMAIQAGQLDGAVSDLLTAAFLIQAGFDFRATSLTNGRFGIVASPESGIASLHDLRGRNIGLFPNTMTQYMADNLLLSAGIPITEYTPVAVPNILLRLEMVLDGRIDAAVLPEPVLTAAVAQGGVLVATTDGTGLDSAILFFSRRSLDTRLEEVKAFHRAYYRAAMAINANPDAFRDFLVDQAGFPPAVRNAFQFVTYTQPTLPTEQHIRHTLDWLTYRDLLQRQLSPQDFYDARAITEWSN